MNTAREIVSLKNVSLSFNRIPILQEVTLTIRHGDFLGIIGPNGGGKTTLLKVILGLLIPDQGTVTVLGGSALTNCKYMGYVPQSFPYDRNFPISVWEVTLMGRIAHAGLFRQYRSEDFDIAADALKTVGMLDARDKQLGTLSGGEKQRAYIARALTTKPQLLLLDEPTASIDVCMQAELYELLRTLQSQMGIVMVSHDIGVIHQYVNKVACLNQRLYYHDSHEITEQDLQAVYRCPIEIVGHGLPHRVLREHLPHD